MIMSHSCARHRLHGVLLAAGVWLTIASASAGDVADAAKDKSIIGDWTITSVLDYAAISIGADQAQAFIGKDLIISAEKVSFGNQVCMESSFQAQRVETNIELTQNARVSNAKLGLPNPVTVVELSCAYAYIKERSRIVLAWNGVFFEAVRKMRQARSPHPRRHHADAR